MAYIVRRVPLNFDFPLGQPWPGLEKPGCLACDGTGSEPWRHELQQALPGLLALIEQNNGGHFLKGLVGRAQAGGAWSQTDCLVVMGRLTRLALRDERAGICSACDGTGENVSPEWEERPPTTGDGWQLWADAAPISMVFDTADLLAAWAESVIGEADYHYWLGLAQAGVAAPARIHRAGEVVSGVELIGGSEWNLRGADQNANPEPDPT